MGKTLVIAEKPSVAQDIVRALTPVAGKFDKHDEHFENDRYVVTSAVGHLVEIQAPEQFDVKRGKWSFYSLDQEAVRELLHETAGHLGGGESS